MWENFDNGGTQCIIVQIIAIGVWLHSFELDMLINIYILPQVEQTILDLDRQFDLITKDMKTSLL